MRSSLLGALGYIGILISAVISGAGLFPSLFNRNSKRDKLFFFSILAIGACLSMYSLFAASKQHDQDVGSIRSLQQALVALTEQNDENTQKTLKSQLEGFTNVVRGIRDDADSNKQHFDETMDRFDEDVKIATGGNSFCYLDVFPAVNEAIGFELVRVGKYPIRDLRFEAVDEVKEGIILEQLRRERAASQSVSSDPFADHNKASQMATFRQAIGDLGTQKRFLGGYSLNKGDTQSFSILFSSFNERGWIERLVLRRVGGHWSKAMLVERGLDHERPEKVLIDKDFPRKSDGRLEVDWPRSVGKTDIWDR